jgi:hypothetical protein
VRLLNAGAIMDKTAIDYTLSPFLTVGGAAAALRLSTERIRQLDSVLQPMRTTTGQRIYRREIIERVAQERAAAKPSERA